MLQLAIIFYSISLIAQFLAAVIAVSLVKKANFIQYGWLYFALGLALMTGRRISPILLIINSGHYNLTDAFLSIPISVFLLLAVIGLKKLLNQKDKVNKQLSDMVKYDHLTSALSRTETFTRAQTEVERALRTSHPIAFLSLDIDYFKSINDTYGHLCGDQVLKNTINYINTNLRQYDFIGRMGGEEFLIVLPGTDRSTALEVAERLRDNISQHVCYIQNGKEIKITVSIGIAVLQAVDKYADIQKLLQKYLNFSDIAMYKAKNNGRNQCQLYCDE